MASLKRKLIESQLLVYECNICKLDSWLGNEISLHIDHINGINTDNRLENLRLLCPNCHSQTETYAGKNNRSVCYNKICITCGAVNSSDSNRCRKCFYIDSRKSQRPTRNELKSMIRNTSFTSIGNKYGVSDNAIRKWCKSMDLPCKKQEISAYSQLEWLNV